MTDTTQGDPAHIRADDLRAKSDELLKLCGYYREAEVDPGLSADYGEDIEVWLWYAPNEEPLGTDRPHPYESIDAAVRLAEAMGMKVYAVKWIGQCYEALIFTGKAAKTGRGPTIAAAICAAIEEAVE